MRRSLSLLCALVVGLSLGGTIGCASGAVQTAAGPRPAAEVQAQDTTADILQSLDAGYSSAVAAHDAIATTEDPVVHASHRTTLVSVHDGLLASWNLLLAWKQASGSSYSPASVILPLKDSLPSFLALAVDLKAMSQAQADKVSQFVKEAFP